MSPRFTRELALDAQLNDRQARGAGNRHVLLVKDIAASLRSELRHRGVEITDAATYHDAFIFLAERSFDVVVVQTRASRGARDFVDAIKEGPAEHERTLATLYGARGDAPFLRGEKPPPPEILDAARARHRITPFILPPENPTVTRSYYYEVVVLPPDVAFTQDDAKIPLVSMILTVDPLKLLSHGKALA